MADIKITTDAIDKITCERKRWLQARDISNKIEIFSLFAYYHRSYQHGRDGVTIEHGSGIVLSFRAREELGEHIFVKEYKSLMIAVRPISYFNCGNHLIDLQNGKFLLR